MAGTGKTLHGGCHCGNVTVTFETGAAPETLPLRACQCSFCRRHDVRAVTDPAGHATFRVQDPGRLSRYRFGLGTAEFLVCAACGVYLGALMADGEAGHATLNVNAREDAARFTQAAAPVSYEAEGGAERRGRRAVRWTPARLLTGPH